MAKNIEQLMESNVESERVKGIESDTIHISHKHTAADTASGRVGLGGPDSYNYPRTQEAAAARHGSSLATHSSFGSFALSNGMHSTGKDHTGAFASSVNYSGGVRQGESYTSDPATGVGRPAIKTGGAHYDVQKQGAGDTFRDRQSKRIGRRV